VSIDFSTKIISLTSYLFTSGAQPEGNLGHFPPPGNFKTFRSNFDVLQKLSKNEDEIVYSNHENFIF